jgi:hypothetical protein
MAAKNCRLFSYKMTYDTGFAPNPFHRFLTLANCMPGIRRTKHIGDWVAGFTSKELNKKSNRYPVDIERLIFLMRIDEIVSYEKYWNDDQYEVKKCQYGSTNIELRVGDNIYKPIDKVDDFNQQKNHYHQKSDQAKDVSGKNVLISKHFYYFGRNPVEIPGKIMPHVPKYQTYYGVRTYELDKIEGFITHVGNKYPRGMNYYPHGKGWDNESIYGETNIKQVKKGCS